MSEQDLRDRIGRQVRRLRTEAGLTVKEAAARVGMHTREWQKVEGSETNPTLRTLQRIANALGVDLVMLLGDPLDGY